MNSMIERALRGLLQVVAPRRPLRTRAARAAAALLGLTFVLGGTHAVAAGSDRSLPNLAMPTMGGNQLWADVAWDGGWRVQRHVWTGHARLLDGEDVRRAWGSTEACLDALAARAGGSGASSADAPVAVVLHGLWRTRRSMGRLAAALEGAGFEVVDVGYPSTRGSIDEHAAQVAALLDRLPGEGREVSFVTHSLGALVTRALLEREGDAWRGRHRLRRAVFIAPPHQGSRLAELGDRIPLMPLIYGEPVRQLARGRARELPAPHLPFLTIAGGRGDGEGWNPLVPGDDDGVVSVSEARLEGAVATHRVRAMHTVIMNHPATIAAALQFLRCGAVPPR